MIDGGRGNRGIDGQYVGVAIESDGARDAHRRQHKGAVMAFRAERRSENFNLYIRHGGASALYRVANARE